MWPLKTILYFVLFWTGCVASLANPIWGVVNYMLAYQLHPPSTWWGKPLVDIGLRFSMLAVGFTIVGLFFGRKRTAPHRVQAFSLWELGVVVLIVLGALNILLGIGYGPTAQYAFEKFWKLQVFVLILARLVVSRVNLRLVIWTVVVGSLYLGYEAFSAPAWRFTLGRLDAFGGSDISTSSGAGAHLAAMIPIAGAAFLMARHWKWKLLAATSALLAFNAVILCRTRSSFLGLMVGGLVAVLLPPKMRRYRIYLVFLVAGIAALRLTDTHYWERMGTLADRDALNADPAVVSRADIWKASGRILADHPTGVGLGNFSRIIGTYDPRYWNRSPHNTLIMCFCELGIFGGAVFLSLIGGSLYFIYRSSRLAEFCDEPLETKLLAYGMLISLVTYFVASLGTERFSCESFWWVLVFPLCLYRVTASEVYARAEEPTLEPAVSAETQCNLPFERLGHAC